MQWKVSTRSSVSRERIRRAYEADKTPTKRHNMKRTQSIYNSVNWAWRGRGRSRGTAAHPSHWHLVCMPRGSPLPPCSSNHQREGDERVVSRPARMSPAAPDACRKSGNRFRFMEPQFLYLQNQNRMIMSCQGPSRITWVRMHVCWKRLEHKLSLRIRPFSPLRKNH